MSSGGATLQGSYSGETGTIDEVGFYYGTQGNVTSKVPATGTSSPFSKAITGLAAGTTYYYKAYVHEYNESTSSYEYHYGSESNFTTLAVSTATVTTTGASSLAQTTATLNGSYAGATGAITEVGFFWSSSQATVNTPGSGTKVVATGTSSPFSKGITGLTASSTYYYRAYAKEYNESTSSYDFKYGSVESFTTTSAAPVAKPGHLGCYEIPAVTAAFDSSGVEKRGSTRFYRYSTGNSNQKVVTHTFNNTVIVPNKTMRSYTLLQDKTKKCALWVACSMNNDVYPDAASRSDDFGYDPAVPRSWQPDMSSSFPDKGGKSYDRGHQLAASYRKTTTEQVKMTCYATNMTPQLSSLNQGKWQSVVEAKVRNLGAETTGRDTLYVVSGPLFIGDYDTVEDKNGLSCAKPTHYFQCFMKVSFDVNGDPESAKGAAYLVEHVADPEVQYVTIDYVESLAGFDFFANVPTGIQNTAEATATPIDSF